jgi:HlyD family secretion protein
MRNKIVVFAVIVAVLGAACAYKLMSGRTGGITATGTIEVTRADITPKVSGYIGRMDIKEGDTVSRGQKVIAISRPDLEAQKLRDELALKKAEAQLTDLEKGSRSQELREAEAALNGVRSVYDKAKTDYARYRTLAGQGAIAAQQLD